MMSTHFDFLVGTGIFMARLTIVAEGHKGQEQWHIFPQEQAHFLERNLDIFQK